MGKLSIQTGLLGEARLIPKKERKQRAPDIQTTFFSTIPKEQLENNRERMWWMISDLASAWSDREISKFIIEDVTGISSGKDDVHMLAVGYERHPDRITERYWYLYYEGDEDDFMWEGDDFYPCDEKLPRSRDYEFGNYWRGPHPSEGTIQFIKDRAKWATPYAVEKYKDRCSRLHGLKDQIRQTVKDLREAKMPLKVNKNDDTKDVDGQDKKNNNTSKDKGRLTQNALIS